MLQTGSGQNLVVKPRQTPATLPSILPFPKVGEPMKRYISFVVLSVVAATSAGQVSAKGNHYGWCNGVGNPHRGSNCGSSGSTQPSQTPSSVPTANQKPATGPTNPQTPGGLPTQVIVVTPQPGQTITGTGQVPPIVGQPGPTITGTGKPTITLRPLPPQVITGTSPVTIVTPQLAPSFTGFGLPVVTIKPNPPQTFVGYGKVPATIIVQPIPQPSFMGTGAIPFPVPQQIPPQIPTAIPSKTPQGTPYLIPSLIPSMTNGKTPSTSPPKAPQAKPIMVPRPKPQPTAQKPVAKGGATSHQSAATVPALKKEHITRSPGRQEQHNLPEFEASEGGQPWHCVASGHGQRKSLIDRRVSVSGALRHVGTIDVLGRDLPALHPQHADCIISIKRRAN